MMQFIHVEYPDIEDQSVQSNNQSKKKKKIETESTGKEMKRITLDLFFFSTEC